MVLVNNLKIGQTVWIKRGETDPDAFLLTEKEAAIYIGKEYVVEDTSPGDYTFAVKVGLFWWAADWISLTPPGGETPPEDEPSTKASETPTSDSNGVGDTKVAKKGEKPSEPLYIAYNDWNSTPVGTLVEVIDALREFNWEHTDEEIKDEWTFYEVKKVSVQYTPAKFEIVKG